MMTRNNIYTKILHFGLMNIKNGFDRGEVGLCLIESEHLHNIPSLLNEKNERRHRFYYDEEHVHYLERLSKLQNHGGSFALQRYQELWPELEKILKKKSVENRLRRPAQKP